MKNRHFLHFRYLLLLEEGRPEQKGVCQGGHSRRFLVLKDILNLLEHHGQRTKGGYAAAGDAAGLAGLILGLSEHPKLKNDEELLDIPVWGVLAG